MKNPRGIPGMGKFNRFTGIKKGRFWPIYKKWPTCLTGKTNWSIIYHMKKNPERKRFFSIFSLKNRIIRRMLERRTNLSDLSSYKKQIGFPVLRPILGEPV